MFYLKTIILLSLMTVFTLSCSEERYIDYDRRNQAFRDPSDNNDPSDKTESKQIRYLHMTPSLGTYLNPNQQTYILNFDTQSTLHTYLLSIHSGDHRVFHIDQVVGSFTCETGDASSSLLNCLSMRWQLDLPYQADQEKRSYKLQIQLHQKEDWQSQLHHENLSLSLFANAQSFEFTFLPENIRVLQKSLFLKETAFTEPCRTEYFRVYGSYLNENRDLETIFLCLEPENSLRFLNFRSAHRIGKDNLFRGRISLKINAFSKDGRDRVHYMIESEKIP